jgi:LuxR family maltose regulon positive regulatory protein
VERLDAGLARGCRLTLVSAPAGSGKTTLVSEWLARVEGKAAWLSLDEADQDSARFLTYLIAALRTVEPQVGEAALAALQSPQPGVEELLTGLLNEIAALPERLILVLDDTHAAACAAVDRALAFLLEHLPPRLHLVLLTRADPALPLPRLRARGQMTELRAADLRFGPAEAADFLNRGMGLDLAQEEIAALETRTEGWIAGLQLAALSMQGMAEPAEFIHSFAGSQRFVLDYLLEEVLNRQPRPVQDFLLRTAILSRLCAGVCAAVLGGAEAAAQETLEALERANLFVVPLDQERRWYRYHHLFGEMLRHRLGKPPDLSEIHRRAGAWFAANGDLAEAYRHTLNAGDLEHAAGLAEAGFQEMEGTFQSGAWIGWVKRLPDALVRARPILSSQLGWAYADTGDAATSEAHLRDAESALAGAADAGAFASLPGNIALARAYNAQTQGRLGDVVKFAQLALEHAPKEDVMLRAQAAITLEFTHWNAGDLEAALRGMRAWMDSMRKLGKLEFVVATAFGEADLLVALGRLDDAVCAYQDSLRLAAEQGEEAQRITAHHHLGLALIAHERGEEEAAAAYLQTAAELGRRTTLADWPHRWHLAQAQFHAAHGEWEAALEDLDTADRVYFKNPVPILRPTAAIRACIQLKQGRLDRASAWARERGLSVEDAVGYPNEYTALTLARVRLAEGSFGGVEPLLERLLALAEAQKRMGSVLEILLVLAQARAAQGHRTRAMEALGRAVALAEPQGYRRIFVDEGEALRGLIVEYRLLSGDARADKILAAFPGAASAAPGAEPVPALKPANQGLLEPLSEREIEILRLVAQGLSNAQIGERLYLALSTVKGHNLRIFAKLDAQSRTEAVSRARALGLL